MMTRIIGLFQQSYFAILLGWILSFTLTSIAFAEIGNSKIQIEQKYGKHSLVQDGSYRIWQQGEGASVSSDGGKAYGYMTQDGEMNATIWIEYNKQNRVVKETTIIDGSIKIRDFKKYFGKLHSAVTAPDSAVFVIKSFPRKQLGVIVRGVNNNFSLIRFTMDKLNDNTPLNMHSRIHSFEITEIATDDVKRYLKKSQFVPIQSKAGGQEVPIESTWLRTDNYFQSELFFSEKLVPREKTDMIIIHHTAIEDMSVADIHELHLRNGWAGIGYHKVILPNGTVENGRPESMIGAHAQGVNPRSIGIVLVGNFEIVPPSSLQIDALVSLTLELMKKYHVPLENIQPHREVSKTVCPGALFPWSEFIQRLK